MLVQEHRHLCLLCVCHRWSTMHRLLSVSSLALLQPCTDKVIFSPSTQINSCFYFGFCVFHSVGRCRNRRKRTGKSPSAIFIVFVALSTRVLSDDMSNIRRLSTTSSTASYVGFRPRKCSFCDTEF